MRPRSKSRSALPLDVAKEWALKDHDPPGFCIVTVPKKGRGVKTCRNFKKGEFLLHYAGELISGEEGDRRECTDSSGYRFFFKAGGKHLCVDATEETERFGRLVNHGEKQEINSVMRPCRKHCAFFVQGASESTPDALVSTIDTSETATDVSGSSTDASVSTTDALVSTTDASLSTTDVSGSSTDASVSTTDASVSTTDVSGSSTDASRSTTDASRSTTDASRSTQGSSGFTPDTSGSSPVTLETTLDTQVNTSDNLGSTTETTPDLGTTHDALGTKLYSLGTAEDTQGSTLDTCTPTRFTKASLILKTKEGADGAAFPLTSHPCFIGRSSTCDIIMKKSSYDVEFKILIDGMKIYLKDLKKGGICRQLVNASTFCVSGREFKLKIHDDQPDAVGDREDTDWVPPSDASRHESSSEHSSDEDMRIMDSEDDQPDAVSDREDTDSVPPSDASRQESSSEHSPDEDMHIIDSEDDQPDGVSDRDDTDWVPPSDASRYESSSEHSSDENICVLDSKDDQPDAVSDREDTDWVPPSDASRHESSSEHSSDEDMRIMDSEDNAYEKAGSVIPPSVSEDDEIMIDLKAIETRSVEMSEMSQVHAKYGNTIIIQKATHTKSRRSDKLHSCLYCCRMYARISRHYMQVHSQETDVAKILALSKKSKERKRLWAKIVNKGNFNHNIEVMKNHQGVVIPNYRPRTNQNCTAKYVPCKYCLGMFVPTDLWKHARKCKCREDSQKPKSGYGEMVQSGKLLLPVVGSNHHLYENILTKMRNDDITRAVEKDDLILLFGERLYDKNGHNVHQHQYISQRLRELGRFLIQMREMFPSDSLKLSSYLLPCNWDKLLQGVKAVAGYNKDSHVYDIASLPLRLGHSLSKCAKILKMQAVRKNNDDLKKQAQGFLELYDAEWTESISSHALTTLHDAKFNKPQYVPLAEDVKKLTIYLKKRAEVLKEALSKDTKCLDDLTEIVLAQLILFNRKRSGETQRMEVTDYKEGIKENDVAIDGEVQKSLTKFERELCAVHYRIEIKGKRGRKVPVLITEDIKNSIDLMLSKRPDESKYLFMKTGNTQPIRGCDVLRKFASACGAQHPQHLTSTRLRKHLATMSQILGLKEEHQDMLAKFMGHDIRVHREFYRLPENVLEVAKVSKVLHLINNGSISAYKGQNFDQIEFDSKEQINDNEDEDDESEGDISDFEDEDDEDMLDQDDNIEDELLPPPSKKLKNDSGRHRWSPSEKTALERAFAANISMLKVPGKLECLNAAKKELCLAKYDWKKIKYGIYNIILARKRQV